MSKTSIVAALAFAGALATGAARAGDVYWSVGVQAPLHPYGASVGTTISNARPVVVQPAPVYVSPAPVYYYAPPPRVVYRPVPVYVQPAPVYVVRGDGWHRHHKYKHKHWKHHQRWDD